MLHGYAMEAPPLGKLSSNSLPLRSALMSDCSETNCAATKAIVAWIRSGTAGRKFNKDTAVERCFVLTFL